MRVSQLVGLLVLIALVGAAFAAAPSRTESKEEGEGGEAADDGLAQRREGAELTRVQGEFYRVGARYEFRPFEIDLGLTCLENLALDRVSRVYEETRSSRVWAVSGLVTEQRGNFFLLLSQAVIVNQPGGGPE